MKKWKIILPNLIIATTLPMTSMASCTNNKTICCVVNFVSDGGGELLGETELTVKDNTRWCDIVKPQAKGDDTHIFVGWFLGDKKLENSDTTPINKSWAVIAKFCPRKHTLHWSCGYGGTLQSYDDTQVFHETIWKDVDKPKYQEFEGYQFNGWYSGDTLLEDNSLITDTTSIVAKFEPMFEPFAKHIVTLYANGGSFQEQGRVVDVLRFKTFSDDKTIKEVIRNTKPTGSRKFKEWVDEYGQVVDLESLVTTDVVLKATYDETKCSVSLINNYKDGFVIDHTEAEAETKLTIYVTSHTPMTDNTIDYVSVNGNKLIKGTDYHFRLDDGSDKKAVLTIPSFNVTGNIDIHFIQPDIPVPLVFETDSWETVAYYANQGSSALCEAYQCATPDWFVGRIRDLRINQRNHLVRVVATNQDAYSKDNVVHPAALTFQFNNLISSDADGSYLETYWDSNFLHKGNKGYWTSKVHDMLNSTGSVDWRNDSYEHKSVYQMMVASDPLHTWTDKIKSVYRTVNEVADADTGWVSVEKQVKIFMPVISNIFSAKGIDNSNIELIPKGMEHFHHAEGQRLIDEATDKQYAYYAHNIGDHVIDSNTRWNCLHIPDVKGDEHLYWLSSPCLCDYVGVWAVSDGIPPQIIGEIAIAEQHGVAPCFCI